ncbi:hypothetical protein [Cohnella zeiphila]|uniref:6-bladed beta-propeller n=1 Tax=Cohnella zeiphila TaxID=2761120 RepID=A0A7X0SSI7_9BACL|nr:hypothetical protein [Cohnella zeiphila]MBB6735327.1 hypothetical protein [Cohnella zeiphila]
MSIAAESIVGNAKHRYQVTENWAKLPEGIELGYTHGIVTDKRNYVYVFHTGSPSVLKFDADGNWLASWGEEFAGGAHGFYLHEEKDGSERLYMTDTARGLTVKSNLHGEALLTIGAPERPDLYGEGRRFIPTDVAVDPEGFIYIADGYGESWIHKYTAEGEYLFSWGGKGSEPGQLNCPHGVSIDLRRGEPEVYVADRGNHRIQVFTTEGRLKRMFDDDLDMPCSFFFAGDEVYIPDLHSRVTILDRNDLLITHLGEDQQAYKQEGWPNLPKSYFRARKFSSPHGVCVDREGSVYVAEWTVDGRLTKLVRMRDE